MSEPRMTRDERDKGIDARGEEARVYYERAMREAQSILASGRRDYCERRRVGFIHPKDH